MFASDPGPYVGYKFSRPPSGVAILPPVLPFSNGPPPFEFPGAIDQGICCPRLVEPPSLLGQEVDGGRLGDYQNR